MASFDAHKNFAYSTVATPPSPATSGATLTVAAGDGTKFPATPFNATVWPTSVQPTTSNAEIVRVTNISGDTLTITRAQESTSARTVIAGDQISASITVKTLTDLEWARRTVSFSTASLIANASENDDVTINRAAKVYSITTNRAARVRAYGTSAHRTADASRAIGTDPSGNHGVLMEVVTTSTALTLDLAPVIDLVNLDTSYTTTIYFAVQNLDTATGIVTTTLNVKQAE